MTKSAELYTMRMKMEETKINIGAEITNISNMPKTMKIREQTHKDLKVYAAEHGYASLGDAIDALLKEHREKSLATEGR